MSSNWQRRFAKRFQVKGIRLDSGDMASYRWKHERSRMTPDSNTYASSYRVGLDEYKIEELVRQQAPIDGFGVGTTLAVAEDAPDLDMAYKLVEYAGKGRTKLSARKVLYPGRKQVFRTVQAGIITDDAIARFDEEFSGEALLWPVLQKGRMLSCVDLQESRDECRQQMRQLPEQLVRLEQAD